jgi:RHS repeat-associated protein
MRNTGTTTWTAAGNYRLAAENPQDNRIWAVDRAQLAATTAPGQQAVFNFQVKAPATAATYNFQWRMIQESVERFGPYTPNLLVTVGTPLTISRTPSPMVAGQPFTLTWSSPTATSLAYQCSASGTGYVGGATLAASGTSTGTALAAWVGNPSTCTWTATGPGGTQTVTETMTTINFPETITYFHNDIAGTPVVATDASGARIWKETYRPYGEKLNREAGSSGNKIGFHGKPFDDNTGLSYMGARYYDPVLGRFTGIDPADVDEDNLHSFNRYAYANNNPYKYVDPDGRNPVAILIVLGRAAAIALAANDIASGEPPGGTAAKTGVAAAKAGISAAERLAANRVSGKLGEAATKAERATEITGEQITIITSTGRRTVIDFTSEVVEDGAKKIGVMEVKVGRAKLSKGQAQLKSDIENGRAVTPVGKNAQAAGFKPGEKVKFDKDKFQEIRK